MSVTPILRRFAAGALLGAAAHTAPWLSANGSVRRWLPGLAGVGSAGTVAITFDDGPDAESTPQFLDVLDRIGCPATFFMLGEMVRRHPGIARDVAAAGHEIAVHGDKHRSHVARSPWDVERDIRRAVDSISRATDAPLRFVRPPFGSISAGTLVAARRLGLRPILWSGWGRDWRAEATAESVLEDLRSDIGPGATLLLHDSDCTSAPKAWRSAIGALPSLAEELTRLGLRAATLSEHLASS